MLNNSQNSSNKTRGMNIMNLRFWGGWFLAIACVCIFLTMGCADGHLGVKSASVTGKVLDKTNRNPIENATVRLISYESVGNGDLQQGYNFLSTTTNAQGEFFFDHVNPDNVIFFFTAKGYADVVFPSTNEDTSEEETAESQTADIDSVSIRSGEHVDIAEVLMRPNGKAVADSVTVKFDLVDSLTGRKIDADSEFEVVFGDAVGTTVSMPAELWRQKGKSISGSAESVSVLIRDKGQVYKSKSLYIDASNSVYEVVELEPETCKVSVVFDLNSIPQYMLDSKNGAAVQILAIDANEDSASNNYKLCEQNITLDKITRICNMDVPTVKIPCKLYIRVQGFEEAVVELSESMNKSGNYVVNVAFKNGQFVADNTPQGIADKKLGNLEVTIFGLNDNDKVQMEINLPCINGILWTPAFGDESDTGIVSGGMVKVAYSGVPTGYDMSYTISVVPDSVASASCIYSSGNSPIFIPVAETSSEVKRIFLDVSKMNSSATSEE